MKEDKPEDEDNGNATSETKKEENLEPPMRQVEEDENYDDE